MTSEQSILRGIKVVDASQGVAGPSAAVMLARYGAEVIKVEPIGGDWLRDKGYNAERMGAHVTSVNVGKRSIALDIKHPQGKKIFQTLVEGADILMESFRPGVMERLGFGYAAVQQANPSIIYTSVSGFGQAGPWREKGGTDGVMQAFAGLMEINHGSVDDLPHRVGFWVIDVVAGLHTLQAMLAALYDRQASGQGRQLDCSLLRSAIALQAMPILQHSAGARGDEAALTASPLGTFRASDGFMNLSVSKDLQWPPFARLIGRPDLADDPSLARAAQRCARDAEIKAIVSQAIAGDTIAAWSARLDEIGVLNERVNDYSSLLDHPQVAAIEALSWIEQPDLGRVALANPPGMAPLRSGEREALAPAIGAHSREILRELGYAEHVIDAMFADNVVAG